MTSPSIPQNEKERLGALHALGILDTAPEDDLDGITRLAASICGVPESLISLVDANRQWFKSKILMQACETSRDISFCGHAINNEEDEVFVVEDAHKDPRFSDNPLVTAKDGIGFYAGAPIRDENGFALGTLCVIDFKPHNLSETQLQGLRTLAKNASGLLQMRNKNKQLLDMKEYMMTTLTHSIPYLIILDRSGQILQIGDNFSISIPEIQVSHYFSDHFTWEKLEIEEVFKPNFKGNQIFYFEAILHRQRYKCSIRLFTPDSCAVFANPVVNEIFPLANYRVNLSHFPAEDYFSEYLFIQDSAIRGLREVLELNEKMSSKNRELQKTKSELEVAKSILEDRVEERTKQVKHMSYFPQQNPNPVVEIDYSKGVISYFNPATTKFFSGIESLLLEDFVKIVGIQVEDFLLQKSKKLQFKVNDFYMEGSLFFLPEEPLLRIYFHDITEIRLAEEEAEKSRMEFIRQQDVLIEIRSLPASLDFQEKLRLISRRASSVLGSQRSSIWFFRDEEKSEIRTEGVFIKETVSFSEPISLHNDDFPAYFHALLNEPEIAASDAENHPATKEFSENYLKPLGICSMLNVPIRRLNDVFGMLCSEYTGSVLHSWTEGEIAFANSMADAISLAYETELLKNSKADLQEKSKSLEDALEKLISVQGDMIRQEKLATLGLLIAGIAHEVNTPLGAIKASNEIVKETLVQDVLSALVQMRQDDFKLSLDLFHHYKTRTSQLSTREERQQTKQIEEELGRRFPDLPQAGRLARIILELGYDKIEDILLPFLSHSERKDVFNFAVSLVRMKKSVGTIAIAVDKAARVVKALNNFSHGNLEKVSADFNLHESVESVITILWNKIKLGARVNLEIDPSVVLHGNQEELSQVWTNLINNALQASNNKCTIKITQQKTGNWHRISFSNDGPPIPKEALPKIFDAFFTTKKQGEGTGLGLNISKQIIEKHGGKISVDSRSGETVFDILLPAKG